jgi:hypothetical protein
MGKCCGGGGYSVKGVLFRNAFRLGSHRDLSNDFLESDTGSCATNIHGIQDVEDRLNSSLWGFVGSEIEKREKSLSLSCYEASERDSPPV